MADLNDIHRDIGTLLKGQETLQNQVQELKDITVQNSGRINALEHWRTRVRAMMVALPVAAGGAAGGSIRFLKEFLGGL